jgi:hypothetical protein
MAKMQGKVKAIAVKEVTAGMQILWDKQIYKVIHYKNCLCIQDPNNAFQTMSLDSYPDTKKEFKTLVVEYEEQDEKNRREIGLDVNKYSGYTKQITLKHSQWQASIDNDEVDSDKIVEFEIITDVAMVSEICYAKIIPQKREKLFTEDEVHSFITDALLDVDTLVITSGQRDGWVEIDHDKLKVWLNKKLALERAK